MSARAALAAALLLAGCSAFDGEDVDIHQAARRGRADSVRKFLRADPEAVRKTDAQGYTALHHAANADVATALIAGGADVDMHNALVPEPIFRALEADRGDVVKVLLDNGAKVRDLGELLREAARKGAERSIVALIAAGAPPDAADSTTRATPLHNAVLNDQVKAAEVLLAKGADPNAALSERTQSWGFGGPKTNFKVATADVAGATPLRLAKSEKMKELLRAHGARE